MGNKCDILEEFKDWLQKSNVNSIDNYISYLKNIPLNKICDVLSNIKERDEADEKEYQKVRRVNKVLRSLKSKDSGKAEKLINAVAALVESGDLLYAITIVDMMCYAFSKTRTLSNHISTDIDKKDLQKRHYALKKFREYLLKEYDYGYIAGNADDNNVFDKKKISKELLSKIDSFDGLILEFEKDKKGDSEFIRFAVEQSFFFSPDIVNKRMKAVVDLFLKEESLKDEILNGNLPKEKLLFARKTTDSTKKYGDYKTDKDKKRTTGCFVDNDLKIPVEIDKDGNKEVRRLINDYTGYTIGIGKKSILSNFIISHLWGQAYDPRYFTNFWNIAIIPAWVNSLLDKEVDNEDNNNLIRRLKNTFMNISKDLYDFSGKKEDWKNLQMDEPNANKISKIVEPYRIKIIHKTDKNDILGAIEIQYYTNNGTKGKFTKAPKS